MKRVFWTALLALPLLATPAWANGFGFKWCLGGSLYGNLTPLCGGGPCCGPGGGGSLGPWYNYWPLDAHFQGPALPQYPSWPAPQGLAGPPYGAPYPAPAGPALGPPQQGHAVYGQQPYDYNYAAVPYQTPFQPVGYQYQQAPPYWYGR
jgi:hypothetical protein